MLKMKTNDLNVLSMQYTEKKQKKQKKQQQQLYTIFNTSFLWTDITLSKYLCLNAEK